MAFFLFLGPFKALNAEEIDQEISDMWRTVYKLTKTFNDQAGPRRIAESVKSKIDKFKLHMPILSTICNPGIRERHWEAVSEGSYYLIKNVVNVNHQTIETVRQLNIYIIEKIENYRLFWSVFGK